MPDFDPTAFSNLVDITRHHAAHTPDAVAFRFLETGEVDGPIDTWTYARLDRRARAIAAHLRGSVPAGTRALLVFPPGMDFIQAFFGCLYADLVAVPAYPPDPTRLDKTLPRFQSVASTSGAEIALTTTDMLGLTQALAVMAPALSGLRWVGVDGVPDEQAARYERPPELGPETIAFIQFTSGSTSDPKGVVIRQRHLLANEEMIRRRGGTDRTTVALNWIPFYHDMGLILGVLHGAYVGGASILMSPMHFLQRPMRWLYAMSRFSAHLSAAPNFAFDLCVRRSTPADLAALDLSSWRAAASGAEPVRGDSLRAFAEHFAACGFQPEAPSPGYGMAECVLSTCAGTPGEPWRSVRVDPAALQLHRVIPS
ncbi:MAG TPA: AMP-binding protein, partial [Myxococcota bacterium]|nr:AMP-binding protein [Myxococcota bacterium]